MANVPEIINVKGCSSCGRDHNRLFTIKLEKKKKVKELECNYASICPVTGDAIYLAVGVSGDLVPPLEEILTDAQQWIFDQGWSPEEQCSWIDEVMWESKVTEPTGIVLRVFLSEIDSRVDTQIEPEEFICTSLNIFIDRHFGYINALDVEWKVLSPFDKDLMVCTICLVPRPIPF